MPARDYSVAPVLRLHEAGQSPQISDISARRRLRCPDQTDVDHERRLSASSASHELDDRSKPSVSSF
jgi:hypothetical protein